MGSLSSKKVPQFILFGDSLTGWSFDEGTQGFGWYLRKWYENKAEVVNEGYPGYTSQHIKRKFERLIQRITKADAPPTLLITIFLGANDACFIGQSEYVPLPQFEANIREFVETILVQDALPTTKIVLITPPPINIPDPDPPSGEDEDSMDLGPTFAAAMKRAKTDPKSERGYRTYLSKRRYAEKIMQIAQEFKETGRVVGLGYWTAMIDAGLQDQGRVGNYDEDGLPGCGLSTAKQFKEGYFTDGLHLDALAYNVLSKSLQDVLQSKWPELAPDSIEA